MARTYDEARDGRSIVERYLTARADYEVVMVDAIKAQRACSSMAEVLAVQKMWAATIAEAEGTFDEVVDDIVHSATEEGLLELLVDDALSAPERQNLYRCRCESLESRRVGLANPSLRHLVASGITVEELAGRVETLLEVIKKANDLAHNIDCA